MSLEDDRKLLKAVREYLPPKDLHPIAMIAWGLYEKNKNSLPPEAVQALRAQLDGVRADLKALGEAIFGLARFMIYVTEQLKDAPTGERVAELMREYGHLYEPFWEKVAEAAANVGGDAVNTLNEFAGLEGAPKAAPVFGQAAPEGSVRLGNLAPPAKPKAPARPPPFKKKK